jgi:hypothetical protein
VIKTNRTASLTGWRSADKLLYFNALKTWAASGETQCNMRRKDYQIVGDGDDAIVTRKRLKASWQARQRREQRDEGEARS